MNLSCVNRFPPFFSSSSSSFFVDVSLVLQDHLSRILSSSSSSSSIKSRQCYLESYQSAESVNPNRIPIDFVRIAAFSPFDPSPLILFRRVFSWKLGILGYIIGREIERFFDQVQVSRLWREEESRERRRLCNVEWCTLEFVCWSISETIRKDKNGQLNCPVTRINVT